MIVFESYGLNDCAFDLMIDNKESLTKLFDIDKAAYLLGLWSKVRKPMADHERVPAFHIGRRSGIFVTQRLGDSRKHFEDDIDASRVLR